MNCSLFGLNGSSSCCCCCAPSWFSIFDRALSEAFSSQNEFNAALRKKNARTCALRTMRQKKRSALNSLSCSLFAVGFEDETTSACACVCVSRFFFFIIIDVRLAQFSFGEFLSSRFPFLLLLGQKTKFICAQISFLRGDDDVLIIITTQCRRVDRTINNYAILLRVCVLIFSFFERALYE